MAKLIEDNVIAYVQFYAGFMEDAPQYPYVVRYPDPHGGKFYCSDSTRGLVLKIMKDKHPRAKLNV